MNKLIAKYLALPSGVHLFVLAFALMALVSMALVGC
jgi:hypothetical protein